ncbi:MAG: TerB family tellurite resistance protein [Sphingomonadales bacterium]
MRNIVIGAVILVVALLFKNDLAEVAPELFFWAVLFAGAALIAYGLLGHFRSKESQAAESDEDTRPLAQEVLLKALARMSYADTNVAESEVAEIQKIYQDATGEEVSTADVRVAARADIYEDQDFDKYLSKIKKSLSEEDKNAIIKALAKVVKADGNVSPREVAFFNEVAAALKIPPAHLTDLMDGSMTAGAVAPEEEPEDEAAEPTAEEIAEPAEEEAGEEEPAEDVAPEEEAAEEPEDEATELADGAPEDQLAGADNTDEEKT